MNKLNDLIEKLCPNGVEYKPLWKVTVWDKKFNGVEKEKQLKVISYKYYLSADFDKVERENGEIKYIQTGITKKERYTTEALAKEYLAEGEVVCIPWGGTPNVKYHKGKFVTGDNRIATSIDTKILNNKFLYYYLDANIELISSFYRGSGIKHPNMKSVLEMSIPVPPLEVQCEIVHILDDFTLLSAELSAELKAREKQYEYYRNKLLKKENLVTLRSITKKYCSGGTPLKSKSEYYLNGTIPWLRTQEVKFNEIYNISTFITEKAVKETSAKWIPENCVIVALSGASAGRCAINKIKTTTNQHCLNIQIDENKALYKYIFYCICNGYDELISMKEGARGDLNSSKILSLKIPLPSLSEQEKTVEILEKLDKLCNDISEGLPAEIEARRKQYEYYRDKLLDFKELKVEE